VDAFDAVVEIWEHGPMTKRRRQHEKAGYYTDADGFKLHDAPRPHHSHRPRFGDHTCDSELAIVKRAIRQHWPVVRRMKSDVLQHVMKLMHRDTETALRVAQILIAIERQNQEAEGEKPIKKLTIEDLLERAENMEPDHEAIERKRLQLLDKYRRSSAK
jgi:hypothetical protein